MFMADLISKTIQYFGINHIVILFYYDVLPIIQLYYLFIFTLYNDNSKELRFTRTFLLSLTLTCCIWTV